MKVDTGNLPAEVSHQEPHHTGAHHHDPVTHRRTGIPENIHRRLHVRRQHRPLRREPRGKGCHRPGGHHILLLMGKEAEDGPAPEPGLHPLSHRLHPAHILVSVPHRPREFPVLERGPHGCPLALGHPPPEDQRFGAPADPREERPHPELARTRVGERDGTDLSATWGGDPEGAGLIHGVGAGRGVRSSRERLPVGEVSRGPDGDGDGDRDEDEGGEAGRSISSRRCSRGGIRSDGV